MTDESSGARPQRGLWNSPVLTALVTGMFGVLTAGIGYVAVLREPGEDSPQQHTAAVTSQATGTPTAGTGHDPSPAAPARVADGLPQSSPNLLLNFAAFQTRMASPEIASQDRDLIVRPLLHHKVVWKGYVDQITPATEPTDALAVTVSLVETSEKTGQSMFKMPAHCRFGPEAVDQIARLAPGDLVTISGTFTDHSLIGTNITSAHLMSVDGHTLSRMATAPAGGAVRH
jgi:hypothetical protein